MSVKYYEGVGRRKTSTARVRIYKGNETNLVNERPLDKYFNDVKLQKDCLEPFKITELLNEYYFTASVTGGGSSGQVGAIQLGIARAIVNMDEMLKPNLRKAGLMTRDPRMVERKKYSRRKARKKPQFSKR